MNSQDVTNGHGDNAFFLIYKIKDYEQSAKIIKDFCGNFEAILRSAKLRFEALDPSIIMGFGAEAWLKLFPKLPRPKELEVFEEIEGPKYTAVSTPGDLFFHIRANNSGACYEMSSLIHQKIESAVTHVDEVHGFRYLDRRSIIGFVDGTENPIGELREKFTKIGDEDSFFKGGSYAFAQKYLHDMKAWNKLPVEEQEKAIGRRKLSDIELTDEEKPPYAHNAVTNIEDKDGNELKILRVNMPFSFPSQNEFGTFFMSYSNTFSTTRRMLENMFKGSSDGPTDRLLDFSRAVTGTLFFIPPLDMLEKLADN